MIGLIIIFATIIVGNTFVAQNFLSLALDIKEIAEKEGHNGGKYPNLMVNLSRILYLPPLALVVFLLMLIALGLTTPLAYLEKKVQKKQTNIPLDEKI